jgi:hypothetical protein
MALQKVACVLSHGPSHGSGTQTLCFHRGDPSSIPNDLSETVIGEVALG